MRKLEVALCAVLQIKSADLFTKLIATRNSNAGPFR